MGYLTHQHPLLQINYSLVLGRFQAMKCSGWITEPQVQPQLGEPAGVKLSAHWLYFGRLWILITGLITSSWLLSCFLGVKSFLLLKEWLPVIPSFPFGQSPIIVALLALTSGSCFITKHSALPSPLSLCGVEQSRESSSLPTLCWHWKGHNHQAEGKMTLESEQMHPAQFYASFN